ncbi:unnamed protein product [Enterobius vermicularis]|uniref:Ground-like domain-containing protein n=1 Tax=Enterobius vermicularis TaxID=51028 RepID=A0A0N4UU54_ENTVE|nr:unnamed protein product [Enterobius vermicularis]
MAIPEEPLAHHDCCHDCSKEASCSFTGASNNVGGNAAYSEEAGESEDYRRRHRSRRYRLRKKVRKAKVARRVYRDIGLHNIPISEHDVDPTCNSESLREIMKENLTNDLASSKRNIQKVAEEKLKGKYNVICSRSEFSYVSHTNVYCQASNSDVTCYAFLGTSR